jgi:predicted HicB family RNase H-like nuclease
MENMEYKDFKAKIEYDEADGIYVGEVIGIKDAVAFHCESEEEIENAFHKAIDNYLEKREQIDALRGIE